MHEIACAMGEYKDCGVTLRVSIARPQLVDKIDTKMTNGVISQRRLITQEKAAFGQFWGRAHIVGQRFQSFSSMRWKRMAKQIQLMRFVREKPIPMAVQDFRHDGELSRWWERLRWRMIS